MKPPVEKLSGRGTVDNPPNRFEKLWLDANCDGAGEADSWPEEDEKPLPRTEFIRETTKSIIAHNDSPDIGFDTSVNPYRGCEHGCIYCYARPTHEYLGFSSGLDFETKIVVKHNAPELLRKELSSRSWKPRVVAMSGVTDCYQPIERDLKLTRRCLEVLADFRNPVGIVTKSYLITRDVDVLQQLAAYQAVTVCISVTTLSREVARKMEPRASAPHKRLKAIETLSKAGIPVGVLVCPVVPGLTDHEIPALLQAASNSGACFAGYNMIQLPYAVKDLFDDWLQIHFSERRDKVLSKICAIRGGKLYDADFGQRMTGQGVIAEQISSLFRIGRRKAGIPERGPRLSAAAFRRPTRGQLELFD
ncbi:MAG TPA: PA0069 family radical SAM protein [Abditibacteriaceae bacterium]